MDKILKLFQKFEDVFDRDIAVAVSGGADSMALCLALSEYLSGRSVMLHALSVNHNLRVDAAAEAVQVGQRLSGAPNVKHTVLDWVHDDVPKARVQERARAARYDLIAAYMRDAGITHLFVGHHMDDQAETFLFRLAKGSGLDGLSCMVARQERQGIVLCRPFLGVCKGDLVQYCTVQGIDFIDDPSNENDVFARVRLRKAMPVLEIEGLSAKRLSKTAERLARGRAALEQVSVRAFDECCSYSDCKRIVFNYKPFIEHPEEIVLRVLIKAMGVVSPVVGYGVRLDKIERLCRDLMEGGAFRKRTLGGVVFEVDEVDNALVLSAEHDD